MENGFKKWLMFFLNGLFYFDCWGGYAPVPRPHLSGMMETSASSPQSRLLSCTPRTLSHPQASQSHQSLTMGNDGGSIPKRSELVKEAAKALTTAQLKEAQTEQQEYAWSTDPLTRKPLARPVVSDAAGMLYNKDSIIEFLLMEEGREKEEMGKIGRVTGDEEGGLGCVGDRVKGLKDVVEVKFEVAGEAEDAEKGRGEKWVCGITGTVLGPGTKACYIVPCGHAFAGSVVREVKGGGCLTVCLFPWFLGWFCFFLKKNVMLTQPIVQRTLR